MSVRTLVLSALLLAGVSTQTAPVQAASAVQSTNCTNGLCAQFDNDDPIPTIKAYSFSMPGAGTATVTFNGSLYCASTAIADRVVDLFSTISTSETAAFGLANTSTLRLAHVFKDESDHALDSSTSFNLQSTKLLTYTSGGSKTVYFRISRARQDASVICYVYGGSFTVIRTP